MSTSGATAGGAAHQIHLQGTMAFHLNYGAMRTFFRYHNTPHTNFATEPITQPFMNTPMWNDSTANAEIQRTGDLLHRMYVVVDLPPICAVFATGTTSPYAYGTTTSSVAAQGYRYYSAYDELFAGLTNGIEGFYARWHNAIGYAMLKWVQLSVGSQIVDEFGAEYLYAWEELTGQTGKRCWDMIGRFSDEAMQITFARAGGRLHIPLPWWFTQVTGNSLALITLHFNCVKVHVTFRSLSKLLYVSNSDLKVYVADRTGASTGTELAANALSAYIQSEMIYLDGPERNSFQAGEFDTLMTGTKENTQDISSGSNLRMRLSFNFPVSELIMFGRMEGNYVGNRLFEFGRGIPENPVASGGSATYGSAALGKPMIPINPENSFHYEGRDMARLSGYYGGTTMLSARDSTGQWSLFNKVIVDADPFTDITLFINNSARMATQPAKYFRQVMPYQHHTRIPTTCIYVMSFALFPEEANPSGALNFSKLDSAELSITLHQDVVGYPLKFFCIARSWNVFTYKLGVGGARFRA